MLYSPFLIVLVLILKPRLIYNTSWICSMLNKESNEFEEAALMFNILMKSSLDALSPCFRGILISFRQLIHEEDIVFTEIRVHSLGKVFHQKDNELKAETVVLSKLHFQNFFINL